jgi:hypothetical protein
MRVGWEAAGEKPHQFLKSPAIRRLYIPHLWVSVQDCTVMKATPGLPDDLFDASFPITTNSV